MFPGLWFQNLVCSPKGFSTSRRVKKSRHITITKIHDHWSGDLSVKEVNYIWSLYVDFIWKLEGSSTYGLAYMKIYKLQILTNFPTWSGVLVTFYCYDKVPWLRRLLEGRVDLFLFGLIVPKGEEGVAQGAVSGNSVITLSTTNAKQRQDEAKHFQNPSHFWQSSCTKAPSPEGSLISPPTGG